MGNYEAFLSALYYEEKLKDNTDQIDDICNRDEVYALAEKYANASLAYWRIGMNILMKKHSSINLIGWMDNIYREIKD